MEEVHYFCQSCEDKLSLEQIAQITDAKCPSCGSTEGFSTATIETNKAFSSEATVVNDSDFLSKL